MEFGRLKIIYNNFRVPTLEYLVKGGEYRAMPKVVMSITAEYFKTT